MYIKANKVLNNFNTNAFIYDVMENISYNTNIFIKLKEHINNQCFFSNHINHLLRCIMELY